MSGHASSHQNTLGRSEDFKHFLWRRHWQAAALNGFVPELLATDGRTVRRMVSERNQLTFQQFDDVRTAEAIIASVDSRSEGGVGMLGYSMFSDSDALGILHTGSQLDPGWLAFPYVACGGRPAGIPTMPLAIDEIPTVRLCAGTQLRWKDCQLVLEVAVEQRGEETEEFGEHIEVLDHLVGWQFHTTVPKLGRAKQVRLPSDNDPVDGIRRTSPNRAEATFGVDAQLYNQLADSDGLTAWITLVFDRRLFCLPSDWCAWWFEVGFPRHIRGR